VRCGALAGDCAFRGEARSTREELYPPPPRRDREQATAAGCACPSESWPICCPCVDGSPSASLEPQSGPVLIFVPPAVIGNWKLEWERSIDESCRRVQMTLHVAHADHSAAESEERFKQAIRTNEVGEAGRTRVGL